jgi:hypothetical protein
LGYTGKASGYTRLNIGSSAAPSEASNSAGKKKPVTKRRNTEHEHEAKKQRTAEPYLPVQNPDQRSKLHPNHPTIERPRSDLPPNIPSKEQIIHDSEKNPKGTEKQVFLFFLTTSDIINEFVYRQFHSLRFHLFISFSIPFLFFFQKIKKKR